MKELEEPKLFLEKVGEIILSYFKTYSKAKEMKTV